MDQAGRPDDATPTTPGAAPLTTAAAGESPAPEARVPMPITWAEYRATAALALCFVATFALALVTAGPAQSSGLQAFEDPEEVGNAAVYILLVLLFTALVLYIVKRGAKWLVQWLILLIVASTVVYVAYPLLQHLAGLTFAASVAIACVLAVLVTWALYKRPEWYIVDLVGLVIAAGSAAIFGISLDVLPVVVLLTLLAVYDAIAVYKTKHMLSLADAVIDLRLPVLLVIPKHRGYSFLRESSEFRKANPSNKGEREAMFMGLGDLVMPAILVVSAFLFIPLAGDAARTSVDTDQAFECVDPAGIGDATGGMGPMAIPCTHGGGSRAPTDPRDVEWLLYAGSPQPSWNWTLDWDMDPEADESGTGLPAQVMGRYEAAGSYNVTLRVATPEGQRFEHSHRVDVASTAPSTAETLARFLVHPPALGAAIGTLAGFAILMAFVLRGNPQAGLPLLNGGAIAGFLVGHYLLKGTVVFW